MQHDDNIYLDYAAATPIDERVLEAMLPYLTHEFYNPSAPYALARKTRDAVEGARARIAELMGAKPGNITFTAGATEANNLALASAGGSLLTSAIEHESIRSFAKARGGTELDVSGEGLVAPETLECALTAQTGLVSVALANGEIGCVQPLRELGEVIAHERQRRLSAGKTTPLLLHTDASQAANTCSLNVSSLGADLITVSAAKMYGPKQVGLLWARDGVALSPLVLGGGQENGLRSGTENVAGIVGFAKAFEIAASERKEEARRLQAMRDELQRALVSAYPRAIVSGPRKPKLRLSGLLHISFPGLEARRLVICLDQRGVSVGTGSACAASKMRTSHVLEAIGLDEAAIAGSLRITLGRLTTPAHIERAARILIDVILAECARTGIDLKG